MTCEHCENEAAEMSVYNDFCLAVKNSSLQHARELNHGKSLEEIIRAAERIEAFMLADAKQPVNLTIVK